MKHYRSVTVATIPLALHRASTVSIFDGSHIKVAQSRLNQAGSQTQEAQRIWLKIKLAVETPGPHNLLTHNRRIKVKEK